MAYLDKYSDKELLEILDSDVEQELHNRGYEYGWHKVMNYAGSIYILVNPAFPNLVKIGYADDIEKRVKSFNRNSGLPDPYHIYATYKVKKRLEDLKLHSLIDSLDSDLRHTKNREFYEMTPEKAYEILSAIAQINGDEDLLVINPFEDDFFKEEKPEEKPGIHRKRMETPEIVKFKKDSETISFKTWRKLEEDVCNKCIKEYGMDSFKKYVFDKNNKKFHTKRKNFFGDTTDLMRAYIKLGDGLFMNTNNCGGVILDICNILAEKFPDASFELVYENGNQND